MTDILGELSAVHREVGHRRMSAGEGRTVVLRRRYDTQVEDLWEAITNPDRINRWFLPVTGDLRLGGSYQLKGNAGGDILRCEPPHLLTVTWTMGENPSEADISMVEVRLSAGEAGQTLLELEHAAVVDAERWKTYGPGAVGVGWDLVLLGLSLHLRGEMEESDREAFGESLQARQYMTGSSTAWGAANEAAGATSAEADAAAANTTAFYVPDPGPAANGGSAD